MTVGRGKVFQIIGFGLIVIGTLAGAVGFWVFWLSIIGIFCVLAGTILGFWGTRISDKGYLETIRFLKTHVEAARKRQEPVWTPFKRIEAIEGISPMASYAKIQFRLWSDDNTIQLMIQNSI